jgi:hypothetical protein
MNIRELTTWKRLSALDLDAADAALPFSARLARDNGWSTHLARRAVEEYKKFCFLAVHAGHPVTPSDEVDQVWHLHLLYSRHYWEALCRDTLETPLHHGPTQGGAAEGRKFHDWYEATLAAYRRHFGEAPRDLWPAAGERFDAHHDFTRVDRRDVMTLDRALLRRGAIATLSGGGALAIANALAQADGADAPGTGSGLWLIIPAILIAMIVVAAFRAGRRRGGTRKSRKGGSAAAAGGYAGCGSSGKGSHGDGNGGDGGGTAGCGSGGCGGGGGGCGGGS